MVLGHIAGCIGRGLVAGLVGTAVMTASSTLEMKLRGRSASSTPSDAAGKVLGVQPRNPEGKARFSNIVHWSYGTAWGGVRGLIGATGMPRAAADATHFGAVWGAALITLPALKVAPPVTDWGWEEVAIDALHHFVYAAATGLAYELLEE